MTRSSKKPPDRLRILASLRAVGGRGITQADWDRTGHTPDGGPRIPQITRRIHDLRQAGYDIQTRGERDGFARYVLVQDRRELLPAPPEAPAGRLFVPPPTSAITGEAA